MPILPDTAVFQKKLAALPLATYQAGTVIGKTVEKIEGLLGASGASLVYAGYPYDPFASDAPKS
jgi:hypothetical protein